MKKTPPKQKIRQKKFYQSTVFKVSVGVLVIIAGWMIFSAMRTYPLGDKMEYIGKESVGSYLPLSSTRPYDVYYYSTDMTLDELAHYFSKATETTKLPSQIQDNSSYTIHTEDRLGMNQSIDVSLYSHTSTALPSHIRTTKKHIISVPSFHYETLREIL